MKPKDILTKELLKKEFLENNLSASAIAKKYQIKSENSVTQAIKRFNIEKRPRNNGKFLNISKQWLYQKYVIEDMSALSIANLLGSNRKATILQKLKEFNIPARKTTKTKKYIQSQKRKFGELSGRYVYGLKFSALKRKITWDLDGWYLMNLFEKQNRQCAISGYDIVFCETTERPNEQTASLDRIDSSKGYLEGNVQWVHKDVNKMKWDLDQDTFIKWCKIITERHK